MGNYYTTDLYEPYEFLDREPVLSTILIIILVIAATLGTGGNLLILTSVATQKDLQNMESIFIVNLACADLYVTMIADPFSIVGELERIVGVIAHDL